MEIAMTINSQKIFSSTAGAARHYFDTPPYPSAQAFMQDWKQLTDQDKQEIKEGLEKQGYVIGKEQKDSLVS